ncbi:MAG: S8 family serine peptidase, partial [Oscillospiraceae bacterium]|nr:S8 family serine peptidase [Oscillospiraceae bacterium]
MKNKIFCFLTALFMIVSTISLPAYANESTVQENFYQQLANMVSKQDYSKFFGEMELQVGSDILTVDGKTQNLTAAPEITNNSTMLPIRAVAEVAGAEVDWESTTSTVLIESASGDTISCSIGSPIITVNDQTSQMNVTPYIKQGNTYMPIRAVAEALELEVNWEETTQTIRLTAPYQTARLIVLADQLDTQELKPETVLSDGTGMWVLQFETPTQAREAAEALKAQGILVEPDLYIPPIDDEAASETAASGAHYSWGATDCNFDSYISKYASRFTGSGVVAVVDSGVDFGHPFLQGRLLSSGYDFIDGDTTPQDGYSHGTHVTGTIIDCVGSAPVYILPVRVFDDHGGGGYASTVAAGIKYAANNGADVINLSLGGIHSSTKDSAISYAVEKGCLVVASAGNDNMDTAGKCPAHITMGGMVVVSSGDSNHNKASSSNYGSSVDLMAPGVNIKATIPGGSFGIKSGTSMAAPHAAAAAILIDLAWGKMLTPAALEEELYSATTYGKWTNSTVGAGFLDLNKAHSPSGNITPKISLSNSSLSLNVGESQTLTANVTPSGTAVSWSSSDTGVATVSGGRVTAVGQGTATITAQIVYNGTSYQAKCTVTVVAEVKPGISLSNSSLSLNAGESQTLTANITPSGTAVGWSSSNTDVATVSGGRVTAVGQGTATITAQIVYNGTSYQA